MKALVISDVHANIDALLALERALGVEPRRPDMILVLGDLVDYGPAPEEVIAWVRTCASHVVRGNHDHAMATGDDCQSSPAYKRLSVATRDYFRPRLAPGSLAWLASLPLRTTVPCAGRHVAMVHAVRPARRLAHRRQSGQPRPAEGR